jgi:hypothetical protein
MYERFSLRQARKGETASSIYAHTRTFEGVIEELKARLQHEQMRFRDLGIRYGLVAAVISLFAKMIADGKIFPA